MEDEIDINALLNKYEQALADDKKIYFDADEFATLAEYFGEMDNIVRAKLLIDEGLHMHPSNIKLVIMKAKILIWEEEYEQAYWIVEPIPDEEELEVTLLKVECLLNMNRIDEAEMLVALVTNNDLFIEEFHFLVTEVGFLFNDVDEYEKAIFYLEKGLAIEPDDIHVLMDLSYAYEMLYNFDKAIESNNRLLDGDPYSFDSWINLGRLYSVNKQYDKALDALDFALTIRENDLPTLKMKALTLYLNDNIEAGVQLFKDCMELAPDDESFYDSLLDAYRITEDYEAMEELIDKKEARFGSEGILMQRVRMYIYREEMERAVALFEQIPYEETESMEYFMLEGELAFGLGDMKRSEAAYLKAALIEPDTEEVLDRLALVSVAQDKFEKAAHYLEHLLELTPDYPNAKARLAFIRFEIGTKEPFNQVMERFSDDELRDLLQFLTDEDLGKLKTYDREKVLALLNEARENRIFFKNLKY